MPLRRSATILGGIAVLLAALLAIHRWSSSPPTSAAGERGTARVAWVFETPEPGAIISSPCLAADRLFVTGIIDAGFTPRGVVWCLDRDSGKVAWKFDDDGHMQHGYSSPCLANGRLYVGEGMHANFACKFYCLDAATGKKLWHFETTNHVESTATVLAGRVYFGAGDDGIYCLDAVTGTRCWQLQGEWHIDTSPSLVTNRLYAGSGGSRRRQRLGCLCVETAGGRLAWETQTELPVWGSPAVEGAQAIFGLGNGRLMIPAAPPERPAGAILCLDAATGHQLWRHDVPDAVFNRPAIQGDRVYFGCRDGNVRCLNRADGLLVWRVDLGSPILTRTTAFSGKLYAVASGGRVASLDAATGEQEWTFDVAKHAQKDPVLLSSPVVNDAGGNRRIWLGGELRSPVGSTGVVYCLNE